VWILVAPQLLHLAAYPSHLRSYLPPVLMARSLVAFIYVRLRTERRCAFRPIVITVSSRS